MAEGAISSNELNNRVYIGLNKTGDNIDATRSANYVWDGSNWQRKPNIGLVPKAYDYMSYTNTNATTDTYTYYTGGVGGTLVATVTIVYTDSTKAQVSTVTRT